MSDIDTHRAHNDRVRRTARWVVSVVFAALVAGGLYLYGTVVFPWLFERDPESGTAALVASVMALGAFAAAYFAQQHPDQPTSTHVRRLIRPLLRGGQVHG